MSKWKTVKKGLGSSRTPWFRSVMIAIGILGAGAAIIGAWRAPAPPILDPIGPQGGDELTLISFTATASDPDLDSFTFSLSGEPAGASINPATGEFTWVPTEAQDGVFMFDVVVTDINLETDSETITVTVNEVNTPPTLTPIGPQSGDELTLFTFIATASDTDTVNPGAVPNSLTYSLSGEPSGATINPITGEFTWTPSELQDGVFMFDIVVTDNGTGLLSDSETVTFTVAEVNEPPVLDPIANLGVFEANAQAMVPTTLVFTATASDPDFVNPGATPNTLTFSLDATSLGKGMTINPATGEFSWSPTEMQDGTHTVTVTVTDNGAPMLDDSQSFDIVVSEVNEPPVVTYTLNIPFMGWGQAAWATVTVTDPDFVLGVPNTITLSLLPNPDADLTQTSNTEGFLVVAPKMSDGTGARSVSVTATDDGAPPMFDTEVQGYTVFESKGGSNWGGHAGKISGIDLHSFSLNPLVTGSRDGTAKSWFPFSTEHLMNKTLLGHNGPLTGVAHLGAVVATGSEDGAIHYYDPATGALLGTAPGHAGGVNAMSRNAPAFFSFATGGQDWSVKTWTALAPAPTRIYLGHTDRVTAVAMTLDRVFSGSRDKTVRIWEGGMLLQTITDHTGEILAVASTTNGSGDYWHASSSRDRTCKLYKNGVLVGSVATGGRLVTALAYHQSFVSTLLAVGYEDGTLELVDRETGVVGWTFADAVGPISAMTWTDPFLYTADSKNDLRRYVDAGGWALFGLVSAHGDYVTNAHSTLTAPGLFTTGSWDGKAKLRDSVFHTTIETVDHGGPLVNAHFSTGGGDLFQTVGRDNVIKFWGAFPLSVTGTSTSTTPIWSSGSYAGTVLVGGQDGTIQAHHAFGLPFFTWVHGVPVTAVEAGWTSHPFRFASGGSDGTVRVWDVGPVPTHSYSGHFTSAVGLSFSRNNRRLAVAAGGVYVYDLDADTLLMSAIGATGITRVALSPNGETVAVIAHPGYLRVYRVFDGAIVYDHMLSDPAFQDKWPLLTDIEWTADGSALIMTRQDGSISSVEFGFIQLPAPVSMFSAPVVLRDYQGDMPESVVVTVVNAETGRQVLTQSVGLDNNNRVRLEWEGRGKFDAYLKHGTFLTRKVTFDLTERHESTLVFDLRNGDANGDDSINLADFFIVRRSFGSSQGQAAFDPRGDLNKDGRVDVKDFVILRRHFGKQGDR